MWKKLIEYGQQLFFLTQDVVKVKREVADMRQELSELTLVVRDLAAQMKHERDLSQRDQRILVLELQHQLDQMEKRLPGPKS